MLIKIQENLIKLFIGNIVIVLLMIGMNIVHAERLTVEDWGRAGYCNGVRVAAAEYKGEQDAVRAQAAWANQANLVSKNYGKAEFDSYVNGGKLARRELSPNVAAVPSVALLNKRIATCTDILNELAVKANASQAKPDLTLNTQAEVLIKKANDFMYDCREQRNQNACQMAQKTGKEIKALGYCWGKQNQPLSDYQWHKCASDSIR